MRVRFANLLLCQSFSSCLFLIISYHILWGFVNYFFKIFLFFCREVLLPYLALFEELFEPVVGFHLLSCPDLFGLEVVDGCFDFVIRHNFYSFLLCSLLFLSDCIISSFDVFVNCFFKNFFIFFFYLFRLKKPLKRLLHFASVQ